MGLREFGEAFDEPAEEGWLGECEGDGWRGAEDFEERLTGWMGLGKGNDQREKREDKMSTRLTSRIFSKAALAPTKHFRSWVAAESSLRISSTRDVSSWSLLRQRSGTSQHVALPRRIAVNLDSPDRDSLESLTLPVTWFADELEVD